MYLEVNNMERCMKGTRIVTAREERPSFLLALGMRAHARWYFQRYSLREKKTFLVCVVLYMYGMQQTKSNVNIIHFKEKNIIDKYVDLVVTYWKVCAIMMVWENEHILSSRLYFLLL